MLSYKWRVEVRTFLSEQTTDGNEQRGAEDASERLNESKAGCFKLISTKPAGFTSSILSYSSR
jgi:hypothetical protein